MSNESCIGANIFAGMLQEKAPTGIRDIFRFQNTIQAAMRPVAANFASQFPVTGDGGDRKIFE